MKPRIALLDDYHNRAQHFADWANQDFADVQCFSQHHESEESLVADLQDFNAVGVMRERTPLPKNVIEQLPKLELIVTSGKKNAAIDVKAATAKGVLVCGTESPGHATAELALLLVMALSRQLVPLTNALKQNNDWQPVMGRDLKGQTLGIMGLGRLGGQLAGFAKALGMNVIAWSENLQQTRCDELGIGKVSREELFGYADIVSIHLRHSERTHNIVGSEDFQRLGKTGYIVNTSRAEIIDPSALKQALDNQVFAGVATDVFENEPASTSDWLVSHPNVLATPHIGYCTNETFAVFYGQMLEAFKAFYAGSPIRVISPD